MDIEKEAIRLLNCVKDDLSYNEMKVFMEIFITTSLVKKSDEIRINHINEEKFYRVIEDVVEEYGIGQDILSGLIKKGYLKCKYAIDDYHGLYKVFQINNDKLFTLAKGE